MHPKVTIYKLSSSPLECRKDCDLVLSKKYMPKVSGYYPMTRLLIRLLSIHILGDLWHIDRYRDKSLRSYDLLADRTKTCWP